MLLHDFPFCVRRLHHFWFAPPAEFFFLITLKFRLLRKEKCVFLKFEITPHPLNPISMVDFQIFARAVDIGVIALGLTTKGFYTGNLQFVTSIKDDDKKKYINQLGKSQKKFQFQHTHYVSGKKSLNK